MSNHGLKKVEVFSAHNGRKPRWYALRDIVETLSLRRVVMYVEDGVLCITSTTYTFAVERPMWRKAKK